MASTFRQEWLKGWLSDAAIWWSVLRLTCRLTHKSKQSGHPKVTGTVFSESSRLNSAGTDQEPCLSELV